MAESAEDTQTCRYCRKQIHKNAVKCPECESLLNWKRHLNFSNTILALLVALVSVAAFAVPAISDALNEKDSDIRIVQVKPSVLSKAEKVIFSWQGEYAQIYKLIDVQLTNTGEHPGIVNGHCMPKYYRNNSPEKAALNLSSFDGYSLLDEDEGFESFSGNQSDRGFGTVTSVLLPTEDVKYNTEAIEDLIDRGARGEYELKNLTILPGEVRHAKILVIIHGIEERLMKTLPNGSLEINLRVIHYSGTTDESVNIRIDAKEYEKMIKSVETTVPPVG